jgi:hypothetical protein
MKFKQWFEPPELTPEEQELGALDDKIRASESILKILRRDWEALGINGRKTKEGYMLERRMATLDVSILKQKQRYDVLQVKYADRLIYRESSCKPSIFMGRICCILAIITITVLFLISACGGF